MFSEKLEHYNIVQKYIYKLKKLRFFNKVLQFFKVAQFYFHFRPTTGASQA